MSSDDRRTSGARRGRSTVPGSSGPYRPPPRAGAVPGGHRPGRRMPRLVEAFLRVRLFWKILGANALLVGLAALSAAWAARQGAAQEWPGGAGGAVALAAVAVSVAVNALILWIALRPLRDLEHTAERVAAGDLTARAPVSPIADRELARLIQTSNRTLDRLLAYRERLRDLAARALDTAEEERLRIARELHDDTAQSLATLLVRLRAARAASEPALRESRLDEVREEIAGSIDRLRRIAQGLRPPALDMLGLVPALESYAREMEETSGVAVRVDGEPVDGHLSSSAELALYRIVQEALSNVARHSGATEARVRLRVEQESVRAWVTDNGQGFSMDEIRADRERGLGLVGMEERAAYVGGRVEVRSARGRGTEVEVEIPTEG